MGWGGGGGFRNSMCTGHCCLPVGVWRQHHSSAVSCRSTSAFRSSSQPAGQPPSQRGRNVRTPRAGRGWHTDDMGVLAGSTHLAGRPAPPLRCRSRRGIARRGSCPPQTQSHLHAALPVHSTGRGGGTSAWPQMLSGHHPTWAATIAYWPKKACGAPQTCAAALHHRQQVRLPAPLPSLLAVDQQPRGVVANHVCRMAAGLPLRVGAHRDEEAKVKFRRGAPMRAANGLTFREVPITISRSAPPRSDS